MVKHRHERIPAVSVTTPAARSDSKLNWLESLFLLLTPTYTSLLNLFLLFRAGSALTNIISDCDETFNYWEPLHYLLYGSGFQTWEYSPEFGLRSWLYIAFHWALARIASPFATKIAVFYFTRVCLGIVCAIGETLFVRSIMFQLQSQRLAILTMVMMLFAPGMFFASTAFLPSTFCLYAMLYIYSAWLRRRLNLAVFLVVVYTVLGWPFAALASLPLAIDCIVSMGVWRTAMIGVTSLAFVAGISGVVDTQYYGTTIFPWIKIAIYNVASGSSTLYGVEPWTYYVKNLFLNFNVAFPLAVLSLPVARLYLHHHPLRRRIYLMLSSMYLWIGFMMIPAHKEERFLFVVYPVICFAAAVTLLGIWRFFEKLVPAKKMLANGLVYLCLIAFILVSFSRIVAIVSHYNAPMRLWADWSTQTTINNAKNRIDRDMNVCIGKEWYRFPSSFFLPSNVHLQFIRSGFKGQLPQPFASVNGTSTYLNHFNDKNLEEPSRYVDISECDFLVDLNEDDGQDPQYRNMPEWEVAVSHQFLDQRHTPTLHRAFFIPFVSKHKTQYLEYVALRRRDLYA